MINLDFLRRNAVSTNCTSRAVSKNDNGDYVLAESWEYIVSADKLNSLKKEADKVISSFTSEKEDLLNIETAEKGKSKDLLNG